jgi:hypothetical protein
MQKSVFHRVFEDDKAKTARGIEPFETPAHRFAGCRLCSRLVFYNLLETHMLVECSLHQNNTSRAFLSSEELFQNCSQE